jgi:hypothetical protein
LLTSGVVSEPTRWPAKRSAGGDAALWVAGGLLVLAVAVLVFGGSREPGTVMLLLCVLAAVLAAIGSFLLVWAIAYQQLAYSVTESALRIDWLGRTLVVPYAAIQGIYTGQRLSGHAAPSVLHWPGISVGPARVRGLGRLRFFATSTDQSALMFISVERGGIIVSARDPQAFRAALIASVEQSQDLGSDALLAHQSPPTAAPWTAFADAWLPICIALGTLLLLLVVAAITIRFDALPDQIPIHFDAVGRPSQIAPRTDLLRLPLLGLICLAVDWAVGVWVHPREKELARMIWIGGAVVQVVLLIGVLRLVS